MRQPETAEVVRLRAELAAAQAELSVARERQGAAEQRAAKLARASAALKETVDSLRTAADLDALLGNTLKAIADQLGVATASAWLFDADLVARLAWVIQDGRALRGAESDHVNAREPSRPNAWHRAWLRGMNVAQPTVLPVEGHPGLTEEQRRFLQSRGTRALASVPVLLGAELVGSFTLHLQTHDDPLAEDLELTQALANQAALAFRLTRLAQQAREAALSQEDEQAARLRAEALARLSASSRRTLDRLAANPDLAAFLGHVVSVAVEQFGADAAGVWATEPDGKTRLILMLEDGVVRSPSSVDPVTEFAEQPTNEAFLPPRRGAIIAHDLATDSASPIPEPLREYLMGCGIRTAIVVPMYLGEQFRGALSLRFAAPRRFGDEEGELAHAFANQVVLAMELTRLTQASRVAAINEERNRLARDIHDTIAQQLAAIVRQLEGAASSESPAAAMRHLSVATELAREGLIEARRSIRALRPSLLDGSTLPDALRQLVERLGRVSAATIRIHTTGERRGVPNDVEDELFRIVNEALTNAIKHGAARGIDVEVAFGEGSLQLVVRDDGAGFDVTRARGGGVGLLSMRERAHRIGAALTIASEPEGGTEVLVFWSRSALKESLP